VRVGSHRRALRSFPYRWPTLARRGNHDRSGTLPADARNAPVHCRRKTSSVSLASRSYQHFAHANNGTSCASSAAVSFLFTVSSVSLKLLTALGVADNHVVHPIAFNMERQISPVNAPSFSQKKLLRGISAWSPAHSRRRSHLCIHRHLHSFLRAL